MECAFFSILAVRCGKVETTTSHVEIAHVAATGQTREFDSIGSLKALIP